MATRRFDDVDDGAWVDEDEPARYAALTLEDDAVIIYDTLNENAWIQSRAGRAIERMA